MRHANDLARLPIAMDLRALSLEEGVRAGLAVAALVALNAVLHQPILLESGLGALLTCLCDAGGPVRRRIPALLCFGLLGGALTAGFGLLRPLGYALIPLAAAGIFCFSFARIYSQTAQQVGNLLSVVLVLSLDHAFATLHAALHFAGAFLGGSLWALLLTMVIWRLHPNRPARQAVARVYVALAAMADDLRALLNLPAAAEPAWERHARAHRRTVRDAIEIAREAVTDRLRAHYSAARPAAQSLLRLESADQIFATLIALTDLLESPQDPATRTAAATLAERLAAVLRALAPHIVEDDDLGLPTIGAAIAGIATLARALPPNTRLRTLTETLLERLRATLNLTVSSDVLPGPPPRDHWRDALLAPIRANLTWSSAPLRHAARAAVVSAAGFAITFTWPTSYQHWLTITLVLTLQPYYAMTLQRALERIGGTVAGGLIAAVLSLVCHTPLAIAAAMFPLSVLALSLRAVNFGLYMAALTPLIVLLVELASPGHGQITIVAMRALYTIIGGALAVLGCIFLWPSWEPDRLDRELRAAVQAHGHFAERELSLLDGQATPAAVDAARRAAGMASNNLEASLSRALLEPTKSSRHRLDSALVIDAALRRMAGRLSAMRLDPTLRGSPTLAAWRDWITAATSSLDQPLAARPDTLPDDETLREALLRIARQLDLCAGALARYGEG